MDEIELSRSVAEATLKGSTVVNDEGARMGITSESVDRLSNDLLPWISKETGYSKNKLQDKAKAWEQMYGDTK